MMRHRNTTNAKGPELGEDAHTSGTDVAAPLPPAYSSVGGLSIIQPDDDARDYTQIEPDEGGQPINVLTELPCVLEPSRKATLLCRSGSLDEGHLVEYTLSFGSVAKGFASMPTEVSKQAPSSSYPDAITASDHQTQATHHGNDKQRPYRYASAASLGVGKTVGHVTLGAVRLPFLVTLNVARGFDNLPALYKDRTYRTPDHRTDTRSGAMSAGKAFGWGLYDGLTGVFTQTYAEVAKAKGGGKKAAGFCKGLGMGIAGLAFKPTAGYYGLVGYTYEGIEKDIRKWSRRTRSEGGDQGVIKMGTLVTTQQVLEDAKPEFEKTSPDVDRVLVKSWRELQGRDQ
ncbi:hypothetical protein KC345_g772 [Hortaea werneckii]|nr:hypothetical protein KC345_g772 [Hortaea werneckii]